MSKEWQLQNPPIAEALIELRFQPTADITLRDVQSFVESEKQRYPKQSPLYASSIIVETGAEGAIPTATSHQIGFRLQNAEENRICIARIDVLTVSFLPPYVPWPKLADALRTEYERYRLVVKQEKLTRVGMRYINRLSLPLADGADLDEYIHTAPRPPKGVRDAVGQFETVVVMPFRDIHCDAIVRQRTEAALPPQPFVPFVLDIDIYQVNENGFADEDVWAVLNKMRERRNEIFFGTFTDKALEPYK